MKRFEPMDKQREKEILKLFYIAYGAGAFVLYCFLMIFVFPWWQASNHPVILSLGASSQSQMVLGFSEEEHLDLAPMGDGDRHYRTWGTELPPRPSYDLSLSFPEGTIGDVVLSEVKILTLSPEREEILVDLNELSARASPEVRIRKGPSGWTISSSAGGRIELGENVPKVSPSHWIGDAIGATFGYILVSGICLMLLATGLRFPNSISGRPRIIPKWETAILILGVVVGSLVHMHLVAYSIPDYWPADSTSYAMKSVSLVAEGTYDTGTHEYELNRMPGFPLFMALIFKISGWSLHAVTFWQGVLFCFSVLLLSLSLRRMVPSWVIGIGALFALISPAAVWASRQIATESTFSSIWMLGLAAFIFTWQSRGAKRWIGWVLFGLATTAAVSIRPNGILLLVLPAFLFIGASWWAVSVRGWGFSKLRVFWETCIQVAIPCAMVLVFVIAWSWRNHESRGYGKPTDLTEVVWANAPFFAGTLDIRAAKDSAEYNWMVNERAAMNYWFHGWNLRKYRFKEITNQYQDIQDSSIQELEDELAQFNESISELVPLRAKLVGWGRVAGWGMFFPRIGAFTTDPLNQNYKVLHEFQNDKRETQIRNNLKWATRKVDQEIILKKVNSDPLVYLYNSSYVPLYTWLYRLLFIAGLAAWMMALTERKYLAAALVTPFLANICLNIYFMYIIGRYVQVLDASIWLTLVAGLACLGKNCLQEPTTESDRRCIPPVKPKRLLTRFANMPGTPQ